MVAMVAAISAIISASAVVMLSPRMPELRAAKAEVPLHYPLPAPEQPADPLSDEQVIAKSSDGHFWADGLVDGEVIRFLVDTGATAVALTPEDAQRLGFEAQDLHFTSRVVTAMGATPAAPVTLTSVTVGGAELRDVDALVIQKGLDTSLLGMSYLGRLSSFQATRKGLVLTP